MASMEVHRDPTSECVSNLNMFQEDKVAFENKRVVAPILTSESLFHETGPNSIA